MKFPFIKLPQYSNAIEKEGSFHTNVSVDHFFYPSFFFLVREKSFTHFSLSLFFYVWTYKALKWDRLNTHTSRKHGRKNSHYVLQFFTKLLCLICVEFFYAHVIFFKTEKKFNFIYYTLNLNYAQLPITCVHQRVVWNLCFI